MIISIFALDQHRNSKVYRSAAPMSSSKMNYYLTEFNSLAGDSEGFIEKDTYNYVYISNNVQKIGMQTTKEHSFKQAQQLLRHIEQNSTEDIFDLLFTIDNTLYGGAGVKLDLQSVKQMDSQDEKIHKMVAENKRLEMAQREKEHRMQIARDEPVQREEPVVMQARPKKTERSAQPVLLIINEKAKLQINKDNKVKENSLSGEVDLVIFDARYRQVQISMKNLKPSFKYSPYLDRNAMRKQVLRFDRDRGLNKTIPLLKWTGACAKLPLTFEFWNDEDDGKFVNIVEIKAERNIKELVLRFNKESVSDIEVDGDYEETEDRIIWKVTGLGKDESKTVEIKCSAFDKDCLFPIEATVLSDAVESELNVEKMMAEETEVTEYEVRKIFETVEFTIHAE